MYHWNTQQFLTNLRWIGPWNIWLFNDVGGRFVPDQDSFSAKSKLQHYGSIPQTVPIVSIKELHLQGRAEKWICCIESELSKMSILSTVDHSNSSPQATGDEDLGKLEINYFSAHFTNVHHKVISLHLDISKAWAQQIKSLLIGSKT